MDFAGSVFDATIGENRRQTDEFIRRTEIAELIRDASGPNINRQIIARQKPQEMGIKI